MLMPVLVWLGSTAQTAPDTLTLAQARALPVDALARRVLGASGVLMRSAQVAAGGGLIGNPHRLSYVVLATAPRSAGFPDLCEAETYTASFAPVDRAGDTDPAADLPLHVVALDRAKLFRRVDAGAPPAALWSESHGKALDVACAATAPVLSTDGSTRFFESLLDGVPDPRGAVALSSLATIAAAARPAAGVAVTCATSVPAPCRRQAGDLATEQPSRVQSQPCDRAPTRRCVEARYDRGWLHWMALTIESDAPVAPVAYGTPPPATRAIRIDEIHAVE